MEPAHAGTHQQNHPDVDERVEGEVERVGDRGVRHVLAAGELTAQKMSPAAQARAPAPIMDQASRSVRTTTTRARMPIPLASTRSSNSQSSRKRDGRRPAPRPRLDVGGVDHQARRDERPAAEDSGRAGAREIAGEGCHVAASGIRWAARTVPSSARPTRPGDPHTVAAILLRAVHGGVGGPKSSSAEPPPQLGHADGGGDVPTGSIGVAAMKLHRRSAASAAPERPLSGISQASSSPPTRPRTSLSRA